MKTKHIIATKPMRYATRQLRAGDSIEVPAQVAKLFVALKKAEYKPETVVPAPPANVAEKIAAAAGTPPRRPGPPPAPDQLVYTHRAFGPTPGAVIDNSAPAANVEAPPAETNDLTEIRQQYFTKMGKRAFNGWDAEELRKRMAEADPA